MHIACTLITVHTIWQAMIAVYIVLLSISVLLSIVQLMFSSFLFLILIIYLIPLHNFFADFFCLQNIPCSSFPYRFWIMLLHGSCTLLISFEFHFFMRIGGFAKLFVYFIFYFHRFQKSFGHSWFCCFFQFRIETIVLT